MKVVGMKILTAGRKSSRMEIQKSKDDVKPGNDNRNKLKWQNTTAAIIIPSEAQLARTVDRGRLCTFL